MDFTRTCLAGIRQTPGAPSGPKRSIEPHSHLQAAFSSPRLGPAIVAILLLFALTLQSIELRAELLFRSAEQKDGAQRWSALKKYANPADTVYPRTLADGAQVFTEEVQVFVNGFITAEDVYGAKVMESLVKRGRQKIAGNVVSLAGNGGEVDAAMELGRLLRKLRLSTLVASGEQCMSSCVFAFMGGDQRTVAGRIGIHRPYFSSTRDVPDRRVVYRQLQRKLQEFIDELDFPRSLYEAMMAVPPESVSMLAPAALKDFYLEGMSPSTQDEVDASAARHLGITVMEYLQQKAQERPCAGFFDAKGECDTEARNTALRAAASATDLHKAQTDESVLPATGSVAPRQ